MRRYVTFSWVFYLNYDQTNIYVKIKSHNFNIFEKSTF